MPQSSSNPIALVTGGSRGIGLAIASYLTEQGFPVAITGRNPDHLKEAQAALGETVMAFAGDASSPADVQRVVENVIAGMGPIDLLVNNAGISGAKGTFLECDPEGWWRVQEVNLRGPMLFMRAILPGMVERGHGTVINVGSFAAIKPLPGNAAYCASKIALARLTDSVANELEGSGVNLFCLSPGLVETDMTRDEPVFKDLPPVAWSKPTDICHLISRILDSDCASLTGRFLHVHDDFDTILKEAELVSERGLYQIGMDNLDGRID